MNEYEEDSERDYFQGSQQDSSGIRYRLEGSDVVRQVVTVLRGGVTQSDTGELIINDNFRLMNEEGVCRSELSLRGSVNKITHLTSYPNESKVNVQIRAQVNEYLKELVKHMKSWGPVVSIRHPHPQVDEDSIRDIGGKFLYVVDTQPHEKGGFVSRIKMKVRSGGLALQTIENNSEQSMRRALLGKEADRTAPNFMVQESQFQNQQAPQGFLGRLNPFNRNNNNQGGWN